MNRVKYKPEFDTHFFRELKEEVFQVLPKDYKARANRLASVKAIFLLVFFIGVLSTLYLAPLQVSSYVLFMAVLGIACLPLILNIGHEAVHHNFSTKQTINNLAKYIFFFLGTSAYFWELRHKSAHHAFANVKNMDLDIEQSTIIRLSNHQKRQKHHSYQHLYMPFAFCFYTLVWFLYRDFKDLGKTRFGVKMIKVHPTAEKIKLISAKLWHFTMFLIIPYIITKDFWLVGSGFLVFHISASVVTTFALISTHVGEVQEIVCRGNENLPYSWAEHQLRTTADFSSGCTFTLHFFGGFNHHVAHHLFPNIPHMYYPVITPLIKKYTTKYALPYYCYPDLFSCIISHFKRLKELSLDEI